MKRRTRKVLLLAAWVCFSAFIIWGCWKIEQTWDFDDRWKEDVEGVIWGRTGGMLCASGWEIADIDDLEQDENGKWYYPCDLNVNRSYPEQHWPSTQPPTKPYLIGDRDHDVGDYYKGRLEPYTCDPGPDMMSLVIFGFLLSIIVGIGGVILEKTRELKEAGDDADKREPGDG